MFGPKQVLAAIARITKAEAEAAGAPREPTIEPYESTDSVYNDPLLADRMESLLQAALGNDNLLPGGPLTGSEDFAYFVERAIPGFISALAEPIRRSLRRSRQPGRLCPRITLPCSRRTWMPYCTRALLQKSQSYNERSAELVVRRIAQAQFYTATVTEVSVRVTGW